MLQVTAYACEFCGKVYKIKNSCRSHENKCFANPKTKACRTCKYAIKDSDTVYVRPQGDQNYGDSDYDVEFTYCDITKRFLSHPSEPCRFENHCKYYREGNKLF